MKNVLFYIYFLNISLTEYNTKRHTVVYKHSIYLTSQKLLSLLSSLLSFFFFSLSHSHTDACMHNSHFWRNRCLPQLKRIYRSAILQPLFYSTQLLHWIYTHTHTHLTLLEQLLYPLASRWYSRIVLWTQWYRPLSHMSPNVRWTGLHQLHDCNI